MLDAAEFSGTPDLAHCKVVVEAITLCQLLDGRRRLESEETQRRKIEELSALLTHYL